MTNLEAAGILHDAVRKEIQPGFIKITISRDEQNLNAKHVKEIELLPPTFTSNNEENELDLTNFVPSSNRRTPLSNIFEFYFNENNNLKYFRNRSGGSFSITYEK
jgi:hypothetical protein